MDFDNNRPIYIQLVEDFKIKISTGDWQAGSKIDSVRSLATTYKVNPNTIQRALTELEREGLCESQRTIGRFVTEDKNKIKSLSNKAFESFADDFISGMDSLNIGKDEAIGELSKYWEEK
ncbi:GntR family transcriptional regulator [uncultured Anaerococcus sp.]|uniref:GntR family transcriptional regulator n=1 Tax=uncultured Anaerococcus sp. TaxID=293428 RepID=UPI0025FF3384|nr:GntR family transcriptional regulator [uncultured Anaerococcus sp.]